MSGAARGKLLASHSEAALCLSRTDVSYWTKIGGCLRIDGRTQEIGAADVLADIARLAAQYGQPLSSALYRKYGVYSHTMIARRFGGWRQACKVAGVAIPHPGTFKTCPVCFVVFQGESGKKSRKCCSRDCSSALMRRQRLVADDVAKPQSLRGRARRYLAASIEACERCHARPPLGCKRLEVHHRDRNIKNNNRTNLEVLCPTCHRREHGHWRNSRREAQTL